jgi:hypothetical protein
MSLLNEKKAIAFRSSADTSLKAIEREYLKSVYYDKRLDFFDGRCKVRVANRMELRQEAYKLLYDLYFEMGVAQKKDHGLWLSIYDALPETTTFIAENDKGCIEGALTVVFDSPIGLPADELYEGELDKLRGPGGRICEFVSLGVKNKGKNSIRYLAGLFYCAFLHAWHREHSTVLVITVHSRFQNFYCRTLSFEKIGPERNYGKVNCAPTVLLKLPLTEINALRHKCRVFPFFMLNFSEQEELEFATTIQNMTRPVSQEEFITLFIEKTDGWEKASPHQKDFIKNMYLHDENDHNAVSSAIS